MNRPRVFTTKEGQTVIFEGCEDLAVSVLRMNAARMYSVAGVYDGTPRTDWILPNCLVDFHPGNVRLMFSYDGAHHTSGWFKNPDYERCKHLSISFVDRRTKDRLPHDHRTSARWARMILGDAARLAWIEGPHTPQGKASDTWHYRVFCDEGWNPIKPRGEVYSTELTRAGWKSWSEVHHEEGGPRVESPLTP